MRGNPVEQGKDNDEDIKLIIGFILHIFLVLLAIYLVIKMCKHLGTAPRAPPRNPPQPPSAAHNRVVNLSEVASEVSYNISTTHLVK
jgi:hypothetical protein